MRAPRVRVTRAALYIGHAGIDPPFVVAIVVLAIVLLLTTVWWTGLVVLALIPLVLLLAWSEYKLGARTCPRCGGSGRVWNPPERR